MSEWQRIDGKPPRLLEVVIVADYGSRTMAALWTDTQWHNSATGEPLKFKPIFWQPLPALPPVQD